MNANKQQGFTLIELIIVIVILGILAVTAAPRFLNLQGDAKSSTIRGVEGSIKSAMNIVYGKAVIAGVENTEAEATTAPEVTDGTNTVTTDYGYPTADADGIVAAMDINITDDFSVVDSLGTAPDNVYVFYANGSTEPTAVGDAGCYVAYAESTAAGAAPVVTVDITDC